MLTIAATAYCLRASIGLCGIEIDGTAAYVDKATRLQSDCVELKSNKPTSSRSATDASIGLCGIEM